MLSVFRDCMKMGEVDGKKIGCTVSLLVSNGDGLSLLLTLPFFAEVLIFVCACDLECVPFPRMFFTKI